LVLPFQTLVFSGH